MSEESRDVYVGLAELLVEQGVVSADQLRYARRVRGKLKAPPPLLRVLKDLGHVSDEQLQTVLTAGRLSISLGELLVELEVLHQDEMEKALALQNEGAEKRLLGDVLLEEGFLSADELYRVLSYQLDFLFVQPEFEKIDKTIIHDVPAAWCREHRFLPIRHEGDKILVAFADLIESTSLDAAGQVLGHDRILPALATPLAIEQAWSKLDLRGGEAQSAGQDDTAVVEAVDCMLDAAIEIDASDIHIEPLTDRLRVRFREDGVLVPYRDFPLSAAPGITSRIKVLCNADIAERRRHQGGRAVYQKAGHELDLRVSFYITVNGEKTVLRLLNRERPLMDIDTIGMPPKMLERFKEEALERPSGVVLVTGPTGSGKTSTLYSAIHHINNDELSIITAEDPVEYMIDGIAQCSLNPEIDLTFEETLRHIVRQDPDVIVIGEIRDRFSAETAIQAALTGHKVITTFHTEDTIGGLIRLINMNIEAFLISSTVVSVLAQRLVRRICEHCAVPYEPTAVDLRRIGYTAGDMAGASMRIGRGCARCRRTGYRGRVAVFELLVLEEEVRDAILQHSTSQEIRRISREKSGLVSLLEDGILKAATGLTTVDEIIRLLPRLDKARPLPELRRLLGD